MSESTAGRLSFVTPSVVSEATEVEGSDAKLLLAHVLGKDRSWLLAHSDVELTHEQRRRYEALLERRSRGEPVAYLTGGAWFYGRRFAVDASVLVPRPETEHLVDEALAHLRAYDKPVVLDVGTGSGAIACTLAAELPNAVVHATDLSKRALKLAQLNATTLSCLGARFELADLLPSDATLKFDCVIANLPYVPSADVPLPPDPLSFEPREAVDGGPDGLREYHRLLPLLPARLNPGALVLLEAAPPTIVALRARSAAAFADADVSIGIDYAGLERYVRVVERGNVRTRGT